MKKVLTANVGGFCFTVEEDAYFRLESYLNSFRASIVDKRDATEIMEDIEARIAEIFQENLRISSQVVDMKLVDKVIALLGYPEGAPHAEEHSNSANNTSASKVPKRLFRDPDHSMVGGVCSGLAAYFTIDITVVRVVFLIAILFGALSFWVYIILWIAVPVAKTVTEKLQMRGEPVTAENILKFSRK